MGSSIINKLSPAKLRQLQDKERLLSHDWFFPGRTYPFKNVAGSEGDLATGQMLFAYISQCLRLRCLGCGMTLVLREKPLAGMAKRFGEENDFEVIVGQLEIFGFCPECRDKRRLL